MDAVSEVLGSVLSECVEATCENRGCGVAGVLMQGTGPYALNVMDHAETHREETGHAVNVGTWADGVR